MACNMTWTPDILKNPDRPFSNGGLRPTSPAHPTIFRAFNTKGIVYDNSPWRPGRDMAAQDRMVYEDDERKLKNVATRIMSNGVEVLVKDKSSDVKHDQRKFKLIHITSMKPPQYHASTTSSPNKSLISSAVATVVNHQQMSAMLPIKQLMHHNYIIKTCMTTYTYLTTVIQNKRSAISTFETIVSVITTESLTNLYATDILGDIIPTKTKLMDIKTIQPSMPSNILVSNFPKLDKRIDSQNNDNHVFDLIQPSEVTQPPCTSSCSCSHTKTESLQTKYTSINPSQAQSDKFNIKTSNQGFGNMDIRPTQKESSNTISHYNSHDHNSHSAPTDKIVEKYTEVINDYSDEKDSNVLKETDLLTNEQAPSKVNKESHNKAPEKNKTEKPPKLNKNKFVVADLLKLGSLGIKGLSQLAPVIEKMTGSFMKRQDTNKTLTTTVKPVKKLTQYVANKRVDSELDIKQNNFPIYIPVDELETSESQNAFTNATLHQNFAWAAELKQTKSHINPPKIIHESPLVNGGIPISPGEIITANSDVIVGKPAVGGPLTLAASGIKLQSFVNPPPMGSFGSNKEPFLIAEKQSFGEKPLSEVKVDDSFDLRPPELPNLKQKPSRNQNRHPVSFLNYQNVPSSFNNKMPSSLPIELITLSEHKQKTGIKNHGRPTFLDYIPSFSSSATKTEHEKHVDFHSINKEKDNEVIFDNSPSSSEIISTSVLTDGEYAVSIDPDSANKPLLVDIQPSRVANVIIPHGSSTALVFAGTSEPHKTGDYIDDPLPYPEPGYFGSFSIDAPQMTHVHSVAPNANQQIVIKPSNPLSDTYNQNIPSSSNKEPHYRSDLKFKWNNNKLPIDLNTIPPPVSNQETHVQVGPHIAIYNPDIHQGDIETYKAIKSNSKPSNEKGMIDKEYENYLAVPPPPPKTRYNHESRLDKNKPYNQRPVIHTQPIQDMKVFLNIQHPVPKRPNSDKSSPKVTSEIYFAAQAPNSKLTPTYTVQIPPSPPVYGNPYVEIPVGNLQSNKFSNANVGSIKNYFSIVSAPSVGNRSKSTNNNKDIAYSVTLNTATKVVNPNNDRQVVASSDSVPVTPFQIEQLNTDIPIGTNIAIRVEDDPSRFDSSSIHTNRNPNIIHEHHSHIPPKVENNQWNTTLTYSADSEFSSNTNKKNSDDSDNKNNIFITSSFNSHANFPVTNDKIKPSPKPVTELVDDIREINQKRPAKQIPNIATNSHGWYSSVLLNENDLNKIHSIKVEATTRKIIPISNVYNGDKIPEFGQKITSIGKPPTDFWQHNISSLSNNNFNIGKPFSNTQVREENLIYNRPIYSFNPNVIPTHLPSNLGTKQNVYDIPIRDNSEIETFTQKSKQPAIKPVYENSEEIYDGEEEVEDNDNADGEVSLESMKVPVVTSSEEKGSVLSISGNIHHRGQGFVLQKGVQDIKLVDYNLGSQTEKPFRPYNKTQSVLSNTIKPINYGTNPYMKPRPFTFNTVIPLDNQLQQPHWQINQLMENATNISYEESLDLNIGEEINTTLKPSLPTTSIYKIIDQQTSSKQKNVTNIINSQTSNNKNVSNETSNIITSTVQIKDKKPLIVDVKEKSTLPTFTINSNLDRNITNDIINLSPPPPALDFSFKPATNDEIIMGMSPPPPKKQTSGRYPTRMSVTPKPNLSIRTPPPYRTMPPRTSPPRLSTQRPLRRPPSKDEVSTYRPAYDIVNKFIRPNFNRDQPSSQLLPPPINIPSKTLSALEIEVPPPPTIISSMPKVVFPSPISSGWLTSTSVDFSSKFKFTPTSIYFPKPSTPTTLASISDIISTEQPDHIYSFESEYSDEKYDNMSSEKPYNNVSSLILTESSSESNMKSSGETTESNINDSIMHESNENGNESVEVDKIKVISLRPKNRTRKPYPMRNDDRKTISRVKLHPKLTSIIKPTKTITRPESLYPTRITSSRKVTRPIINKPIIIQTTPIIESSESSLIDDFMRPTEVLQESHIPTILLPGTPTIGDSIMVPTLSPNSEQSSKNILPIHHAGNEIKVSDEIVQTKTEFRTTVVTLTKTLSEPPKIISSIGYVNLTHTLTVTHTETSLLTQSEGAVTQTLIVTNTHTSTIVDVVTEVHTEVQPTTVVETVTKHIAVPQVEPTPVQGITKTKLALDDISMSSEESDNFIIKDNETTENIQKIDADEDNDTFFVVMNKSQNGGKPSPANTDIETGDYDGITRNEQVNSNGVSQVLFGEILLAGTPYLETTNVGQTTAFGKECQPDCKASRNERCQRIDNMMKCVCRPGFARMFPDRPCKPTYTYSVKLALGSQGNERLYFHENLSDNSSKQYHSLAIATHEGINRMVMQSDLRDVYHGVHITGFKPVERTKPNGEKYKGVINDFYVQLSDNAHESRLKEVIEKYLRNNNNSLGGTEVHAAGELMDRLDVSDFDECISGQFHDCSEYAQCFNLRGTYTCSCLEGYADLSVNPLYPGRICSAEPVGCERCNYHGACYSRDDHRVLCECFQWYAGSSCHINLKVVLISLVVLGALLTVVLAVCAVVACSRRPRPQQRSIVACIQGMPSLHQGTVPKQRADRRALINDRTEAGDASSVQNASLPYLPSKRLSASKKCLTATISEPPAHDPPPPPPAPAVIIPRARLHPHHSESRDNLARKRSLELSNEAKLISYLESGATTVNDEMRRKHSLESSYSANKDRHTKQGALVSAGFKVSTTIRPDEQPSRERKDDRDDLSSINKTDIEDLSRFNTLRKSYSQEDLSEWTDAERRIGELTLSEARSVGGTLPASTGRAASSTRLTHQEANTMAERDLGSTFLLPHVHLYKPDLTSDVSEFDSL